MDVPFRFMSVRTLLITVLAALAVSGSAQAMPRDDDTLDGWVCGTLTPHATHAPKQTSPTGFVCGVLTPRP
jgi:hypothetical protein